MRTLPIVLYLAAAALGQGPELRQRLDGRQPVTVLFLGDSVTGGMHVEQPQLDAFPALFMAMLGQQWPDTPLQAVVQGIPGRRTGGALAELDATLATVRPQLVVVQFGGNDKGTGDGLDELPAYRNALGELLRRLRAAGVACLLATPPMHELVTDQPYPVAARETAQAVGVGVADFDGALKRGEVDYRGLFPYFMHPHEHGHAIMAQTLWSAFLELLGERGGLSVSVPRFVQPDALLGTTLSLPLTLRNTGAARGVTLVGRALDETRLPPMEVPAGGEVAGALPLALPLTLSGGRSLEWPLLVAATTIPGAETAFALARVAVVPQLAVPRADSATARLPVATLGAAHVVMGQIGPGDLAAEVRLAADADALTITVDVTDDVVNLSTDPPFGDGVEIYLDLRSDADRGKPFYTRQCATLFVGLPAEGAPAKVISVPEDQTPPALLALVPQFARTPAGYRIALALPRAVLDAIAGRRVTALGFDLAIDDNDEGDREAQLIWFGRADNFVNPLRWGELRLDDTPPPGSVRVSVF